MWTSVEVETFMVRFPFFRRECVMLMPLGKTPEDILAKEPWLQEKANEHSSRISPRAHLFWLGAADRF